jgi:hypothetical protein
MLIQPALIRPERDRETRDSDRGNHQLSDETRN